MSDEFTDALMDSIRHESETLKTVLKLYRQGVTPDVFVLYLWDRYYGSDDEEARWYRRLWDRAMLGYPDARDDLERLAALDVFHENVAYYLKLLPEDTGWIERLFLIHEGP